MRKFSKFFCVGILNTAIDFTVLNALLILFGMGTRGIWYPFFKSIAFLLAVANSYIWNTYWVFGKAGVGTVREPMLFFIVSLIGIVINVVISFTVLHIAVYWHTVPYIAANIGALCGTLVVLVWNFIGYKYIVFTDHHA